MIVDSEIILLALDAFKELGLDAYVEVNNRKLLRGIIEFAGIPESLANSVIISVDKMNKVGKDGVIKELDDKRIARDSISKLISAFSLNGSFDEKLNMLKGLINNEVGKEGLKEIEETFSYFSEGQKKNIIFNASLARGLGYYTGTIFEGFVRNSEVTSSICGGGRYDKMIPGLLQNEREYPCVGISFGLDVITDVFKTAKKAAEAGSGVGSDKKTVVKVYVIPIKTTKECFGICSELRKAGINADMDFQGRGVSKNLDYANSEGIPFVIIIGPKELGEKKVKLKNMISGEEEMLTAKGAITRIKKAKA